MYNVEFDTAFTLGINDADDIIVQYEDTYTPYAEIDENNTISADVSDWKVLTGFSNQQGLDNGNMHTSETLSEGMLQSMMEQNPVDTVYVVTEVINPDDMDELIGWTILALMD